MRTPSPAGASTRRKIDSPISRAEEIDLMLKQLIRFTGIALFVGASAALFAPAAMAQSEQQKLVNDAQKSLSEFLRDSQMTWLQQNFHRAKAVIIAPQLLT